MTTTVKVEEKHHVEGRGEIWVVCGFTKDSCPKVGAKISDGELEVTVVSIEHWSDRWSPVGFIVRK